MVGTFLSVYLGPILLCSFIIYLIGMATPLFLLRMMARDQQDSCFLNTMLWAITAMLGFLLLILFIGL